MTLLYWIEYGRRWNATSNTYTHTHSCDFYPGFSLSFSQIIRSGGSQLPCCVSSSVERLTWWGNEQQLCEWYWKQILQPVQMTATPTNNLIAILSETLSQNHPAKHLFILDPQKLCEKVKLCWFKLLHFGPISYAKVVNDGFLILLSSLPSKKIIYHLYFLNAK